MTDVLVIVGPGVVADRALLGEVAEREFAALGVSGRMLHARTAAEVHTHLPSPDGSSEADGHRLSPVGSSGTRGPGDGVAVVVVPGPADEVRQLMTGPLRPVVWLDLTREDDVPEGIVHLHGRGVSGLTWAIRHAVHRAVRPGRRVPYGTHRDQWAELHLPDTSTAPSLPVVALIHGGYWRSIWGADLMDALCADLAARGFAVWNLEYRRPDLHGWAATTADVAAGLEALSTLDAPLNLDKVAVAGHSAGGQLALRAAADGSRVALAVSLAGVLDLVEGERRWLSSGAVAAALGASHLTGEIYAGASPLLRVPMKVPQLVVQGSSDDLDLVDFARRYARAAKEGGDSITYLEMSGDHFSVIDPRTPIWRTTALAIADTLR